MLKRIVALFWVISLSAGIMLAGSNSKKEIAKPMVLDESALVPPSKTIPKPLSDLPPQSSAVGTYTTLQGFYDYQINGGAAQHIRVNPANGNIHVIYMADPDSAVAGYTNRGTYYAFSTNGGVAWNNFSNLRVPSRRSGFGTLDLGQGSIAGAAIISNHAVIGAGGIQGTVFIDFPEGGGAFAEITPPGPAFGSDEAIWPYVAGVSDGSVVMAASRSGAGTNHYARTADFVAWSPLALYPGLNSAGGRYPTHSNGTGRVGILLQAVNNGTFFIESTNNGLSWSSTATEIHPAATPGRVAGVDTFQAWVGADFTYNGNTPLFVVDELNLGANHTNLDPVIGFYSAPTGWKTIATNVNTPNVPPARNRAQANTYEIGYPAIGMSGTQIVVVYQAMQRETSALTFNYIDIFAVRSTNSGNTWSRPYNVTQTPALDERYPSISPWNEAGIANITWQEDTEPGSSIRGSTVDDGAPITRARQKFLKLNLNNLVFTGVGEDENGIATKFKLAQNFPNPFNPATKIDYHIAKAGLVTLKVYDVLGKEVATLLNEELQPGSYQVTFDGGSLASGIYMYKMTTNGFAESKKMMLVK